MNHNEFKIIAHGVDIEQVEDRPGAEDFRTETWVVRFPPDALNEWHASRPVETDCWEQEYPSLDEAEKARLEHKRRRDALFERVKKALGIYGYAEVMHTMSEIFTVVYITTVFKVSDYKDSVEPPNGKHIVTQWDSFNKTMFLLNLLSEPLLNKEGFRVSLTKDPESKVVRIDCDFSSGAESDIVHERGERK